MDGSRGAALDVPKLRRVVAEWLSLGMPQSGRFWAEKLVAVTNGNPADVYLLAQCQERCGEARTALAILAKYRLVNEGARFQLLAARCHAACEDWQSVVNALEDGRKVRDKGGGQEGDGGLAKGSESERAFEASSCLLLGRAYAALENHAMAVKWYMAALRADPFCYEALEALADNFMITSEEMQGLLQSLPLGADENWVLTLLKCKVAAVDASSELQPTENKALSDAKDGALGASADVIASRAGVHYSQGDFESCFEITRAVVLEDNSTSPCLLLYLASAYQLRHTNELFLLAHRLADDSPGQASSWYAVGCYYMSIGQYDSARRYFSKATTINKHFAPAWIGFAHAFAEQDESDQAMAAYRTAARLFPGSHIPLLAIGMEYGRTSNFLLAEQFLVQASSAMPWDPLVYNELAIVKYKNRDYSMALRWMEEAIVRLPQPITESWVGVIANMGHIQRKLFHYSDAVRWYEEALVLQPKDPSILSALGFTYHLQGAMHLGRAIEYYHKALAYRPRDSFAMEMLSIALKEDATREFDMMEM